MVSFREGVYPVLSWSQPLRTAEVLPAKEILGSNKASKLEIERKRLENDLKHHENQDNNKVETPLTVNDLKCVHEQLESNHFKWPEPKAHCQAALEEV